MTAIAKWAAGAGVGLTWTPCFAAADLNSLASSYAAVSSVTITNGTGLDLYADVSFSLTGTTPSSGSPFVALYLLPLNQDGSTFGDGTVSGSVAPVSSYSVGQAGVPLSKSGVALTGMFRGIVLPPGSFVLALINGTGNALASSGHSIKYRTYNENLNG